MSTATKAIVGCALLIFIATNVFWYLRKDTLPDIQGVFIPDGKPLSDFKLISHNKRAFANEHLMGRWSFLSYGYTDCPDICPMTLSKLEKVRKSIVRLGKYTDLDILFYTVDPQRDTPARLYEYVGFFNPDFIGLTWDLNLNTNHIPFEKSLGITSAITPISEEESAYDVKGYRVSHGTSLYLLNPEGKLQAVLKPDKNQNDIQFFETDKILRDYLKIRRYFDS